MTNSIPVRIALAMASQEGQTTRDSEDRVEAQLNILGIAMGTELATFFLTYSVSAVFSPVSREQLLDPASPTPQVLSATRFVRDVWDIPAEFVCLTSPEGEGAYLYNLASGAVFDFSLTDYEALVQGALPPRWLTFFHFMSWYLGADDQNPGAA